MRKVSTLSRYSPLQITLHWLMAIAMIVAFIIGEQIEDAPRGAERALVQGWHIAFGLTVAILLLLRLIALRQGRPALPATMSRLERGLATLSHVALYGTMLLLPVLGVASLLTGRRPTPVLGLFEIPAPWPDSAIHRATENAHGVVAKVFLFLVIAHVLATLWHAVVKRDGVAGRMLPFLSR